ncbi:hypothetical protein BJP37_25420 [Moorena bouillonii PNG]|uniref:Uncharacterized protein n=1 Tax=Moorena bouillonii PNG TaxID=568701 RepID=A0A1U7N7D9_9CYAN|nr:hypothetical protein BJP37_25420 [Moorena bouillonii PNG]
MWGVGGVVKNPALLNNGMILKVLCNGHLAVEWASWWNGHLGGTGILPWNGHLGGTGILPVSSPRGQDAHSTPIHSKIQQHQKSCVPHS